MDKILLGLGIIVIVCFIFNLKDLDVTLLDTYSQFGQDIDVLEYLNYKENGYFIEVGAYDGIELSNTYLLEKKYNWEGLCIEPQEYFYQKLKDNRNCYNDNSLIYSVAGKILDFSDSGDGLSGITDNIVKYEHVKNSKQVKKKTETLNNLLIKYNLPNKIDYLSIDTEGSELEVLKGINFDNYEFSIITIEHNNIESQRKEIRTFLESKGYKFYKEKNVDDYYIK